MKAITVKQPWAWAITEGRKAAENRTWITHHRGLLAIHAAVRWAGPDAHREVSDLADCHVSDVRITSKHLGAVVAVVDLTDICTALLMLDGTCDCGPWAMGGHAHWRLANPRPLVQPVPCKGRLGLWDLPAEVETAVRMQIAPPVQDMRFCPYCRETKSVGHDCPAGAVGCTAGREDGTTCGVCPPCLAAQRQGLAARDAEFKRDPYGSPSDIDHP